MQTVCRAHVVAPRPAPQMGAETMPKDRVKDRWGIHSSNKLLGTHMHNQLWEPPACSTGEAFNHLGPTPLS